MNRLNPRLALLCHLEPSLLSELRTALSNPDLDICVDICQENEDCSRKIREQDPDIIFCPLSAELATVLASLIREVPVIVVSRIPDTREWINAMEAGACDYCAPPFEFSQMRWMLNAATHGSPVLHASA